MTSSGMLLSYLFTHPYARGEQLLDELRRALGTEIYRPEVHAHAVRHMWGVGFVVEEETSVPGSPFLHSISLLTTDPRCRDLQVCLAASLPRVLWHDLEVRGGRLVLGFTETLAEYQVEGDQLVCEGQPVRLPAHLDLIAQRVARYSEGSSR